jgi:transposase
VAEDREVRQEVRTFATTMSGLLELSDWLTSERCSHVAMESTGVYWKPVWYVLDGAFELLLANAGHIRNVPGRKTDVNDATWIADLLAHGLLRGSFVPPAPIQELRDLTRTRKQLVRERSRHVQRIQKTLESANLKLTTVLTDVMGVSGRAVIEALLEGETDPERLARHLRGRIKASPQERLEGLRNQVREHHRFLLRLHLGQVDALHKTIEQVEERLGELLAPFRERVELLKTIPGVSDVVAHVLVSEIGLDMTRFPSDAHLISWAGLCPRSDESAGKRRSTRVRKGAPWLKTVLVQAAWAAVRTKDSYLRAQFLRLKSRRGAQKAIVAVAASMLTSAYHILRTGQPYRDLGPHHFDRRDKTKVARRLVRRLMDLGLRVHVEEVAA